MLLDSSYIVAQMVFLSFTSLQGQVAAIYITLGLCCQGSLQFTRQVALECPVLNYPVSVLLANWRHKMRKSRVAANTSLLMLILVVLY